MGKWRLSMKEMKVINLTKTYGEKTLFDDISFSIKTGERVQPPRKIPT